ncbi:MAG: hypothetical protein COB66_00235 [Coxiella sp. (in: Bacteria)]|nr:MAG: hypothetical protein COB66_00235 [Coxiella sp. (in: g-proteobacteria)]
MIYIDSYVSEINNAMKYVLPPLKSLPVFAAVAQHLSFSRAAEALHVTHSAVSQSIKQLESFLEVQLFVRDSNGVTLTEEGSYFYDKVSQSLKLIEKGTRRLMRTKVGNVITFNLFTALTTRWLIARLPNFQMQYPDIDLRISSLGRDVNFKYDDIDAMIDYTDAVTDDSLYHRRLFGDRLILVASPKLLQKKQPLEQLVRTHKAIYVEHALRLTDWEVWCQQAGVEEPDVSNRIYFQNSNQAILAANMGMGLLVSHNILLVDDLVSGQLRPVNDLVVKTGKHYYFVSTKQYMKLKRIQNLCDWLSEEAALCSQALSKL